METTYFGNDWQPSNDPYVVNGAHMGEDFTPMSPKQIFNLLVDNAELGKQYSTDKDNVYVCTTFVSDDLTKAGFNADDYMPGGQKVIDSIKDLNANKSSGIFKATEGKNPSEGTYVFYFDYGGGSGHTGFVNFDENGNATVLHNGGSENPRVQIYERNNRDFYTWFGLEGTLYYKQVTQEEY